MLIAVEEISPCRKKINVDISEGEINKEFEKAYKKKAKNVVIKGFRKGKTPISIIRKDYQKEIESYILKKFLQESYEKALEENSFEPVGNGEIDDSEIKIKEGEKLNFNILVNIRPEVNLRRYKGLQLTCKAGEEDKLSEQAAEMLVRSNPVEYPEHMLKENLANWENANKKLKEEKTPLEYEEIRNRVSEQMISSYKLDFIISEIERVEKISISEEDFAVEVNKLISQFGEDKVKKLLEQPGSRMGLWGELQRRRVMDFVIGESEKIGEIT